MWTPFIIIEYMTMAMTDIIARYLLCASGTNKQLKIVLYHAVSKKKKYPSPPLPMQNMWAILYYTTVYVLG